MPVRTVPHPEDLFDHTLRERVDVLFKGENLLQAILHAHLLVERALNLQLARRFAKPDILTSDKYRGFTFATKVTLFVGLYDPPEDLQQALLGLNKLRNTIAHQLVVDEADAVRRHLLWQGESEPPDPLTHVKIVAMLTLMALEAITAARYLSDEAATNPDQQELGAFKAKFATRRLQAIPESVAKALIRGYMDSGFPDEEIIRRIREVGPSVLWIQQRIEEFRQQEQAHLEQLAAAMKNPVKESGT